MNKKGNIKIIQAVLVIVVIIILLLFIFGTDKSGGGGTTTTSGGGSSGGGSEDYTGWSWPSIDTSGWFDWFDFSFPTGDATDDSTPTSICSRDSDCTNICSNPTYARCVDGECSCTPIEPEVCEDTDISRTSQYLIKGTCYEDSDSRGLTDKCDGLYLIEYYCRTDTACASLTINCEAEFGRGSVCLDGRCTG